MVILCIIASFQLHNMELKLNIYIFIYSYLPKPQQTFMLRFFPTTNSR